LNELYPGRTVVVFGHGAQLSAVRILLGDPQMVDETGYIDWRRLKLANAESILLSKDSDAAMVGEKHNDIQDFEDAASLSTRRRFLQAVFGGGAAAYVLFQIPNDGGFQRKKIFLIGHSHTLFREYDETERVVSNIIDNIEGGEESQESSQYRNSVEELIEKYQMRIDIHRKDVTLIKQLLSDPKNKIKALGVETSEESLEIDKKMVREELLNLKAAMKRIGIKDHERYAEDLFLLMNGAEYYLFATNDPLLDKIKLVALDDKVLKKEQIDQLRRSNAINLKIRDMKDKGQFDPVGYQVWHDFMSSGVHYNQIPSDEEINTLLDELKTNIHQRDIDTQQVMDLVRESIVEVINNTKIANKRDEKMVEKSLAVDDNLVIVVGFKHSPGISQGLMHVNGVEVQEIRNIEESDEAALVKDAKDLGGIDLNPAKLDLETKGEGVEFNLPTPAELENMEINGLTPIIFNITPITNLPLFLGAKEQHPQESHI